MKNLNFLTLKKTVTFFLVIMYLGIFTTGTLDWYPKKNSFLRPVFDLSQSFMSVGGSFGFFSPNVGDELILEFAVHLPGGKVHLEKLNDFPNREVRLRLGNMMRIVGMQYNNEDMVRSLMSSFSLYYFRKYREAIKIQAMVKYYNVPTFKEFNEGKRPELTRVYSGYFSKHKS